jgi:hypothetical protein
VYAHLCRKLRFPLICGHARGCYLAINDALEQLHGSDEISPALASSIELYVSERTVKVLRSLSIESLQHLVEYDRLDLESDMAEHHLYDLLVLMEVAKVRDKYEPYLKQHQVDEE